MLPPFTLYPARVLCCLHTTRKRCPPLDLLLQASWTELGCNRRFAASAAQQQHQQREAQGKGKQGLQVQQQEFDAITDQIPLRPVGAVEATSYSFLIIAGLGLAGTCQSACLIGDVSLALWCAVLLAQEIACGASSDRMISRSLCIMSSA